MQCVLENRAWRGLRVYTPDFAFDGKRLCLEIGFHPKQGPIAIQEYWDYNENGKRHCYGGYIKETFETFQKALEFIKVKYGVECSYPEWTKELTSEWTWEQNIAYAEDHKDRNDVGHEIIQKMAVGRNIRCIEIEELEFIRDNPNTSTEELRKKFDFKPTDEFKFSVLSRLCHDYGNKRTPLIKQTSGEVVKDPKNSYEPIIKNEGWLITEHGLRVIREYNEAVSKNGFFDGSLY